MTEFVSESPSETPFVNRHGKSSSNDSQGDSFEKIEQINPVDVRLSAMNYLARREHSRRELLKKLSRRFDDSNLVAAQVERLTAEGLQSDKRFAESYARMRAGRGFGPLRIRQEMRERGLSDAEIVAAFDLLEVSWYDLALAVHSKKFGRRSAVNTKFDLKERARQTRFMQHRGFTSAHYQHLFAH